MSETFDFNALVPPADGRDAVLLAHIARLNDIRRQLSDARRRGATAEKKVMNSVAQEYLRVDNAVIGTPALTAAGRYAKAVHALRDIDPDDPQFPCWNGAAISVLWDILEAGEL